MLRTALLLLPLTVIAAGVAQAGPITLIGNASLSTTGAGGVVGITNDLSSQFDVPLTVGDSDTVSFLVLAPVVGNGTKTYNFTIAADFSFTSPGIGSVSEDGTGSLSVHGNKVTSDILSWSDGTSGADVTLSNGDVFNIALSDFSSSGWGAQTVTATFALVSAATPVPEPASLVLLGSALAMLGMSRRRRV